jgi:hypothetical protein
VADETGMKAPTSFTTMHMQHHKMRVYFNAEDRGYRAFLAP